MYACTAIYRCGCASLDLVCVRVCVCTGKRCKQCVLPVYRCMCTCVLIVTDDAKQITMKTEIRLFPYYFDIIAIFLTGLRTRLCMSEISSVI